MIDYFKGIYGINLLFRIHGSALYKGSLAGILSLGVYLAIVLRWNENGRIYAKSEESYHGGGMMDGSLDHPYGVGVLVGSVTFLIIFRANSGYQRYWEACVSTWAVHILCSNFAITCMSFISHIVPFFFN